MRKKVFTDHPHPNVGSSQIKTIECGRQSLSRARARQRDRLARATAIAAETIGAAGVSATFMAGRQMASMRTDEARRIALTFDPRECLHERWTPLCRASDDDDTFVECRRCRLRLRSKALAAVHDAATPPAPTLMAAAPAKPPKAKGRRR